MNKIALILVSGLLLWHGSVSATPTTTVSVDLSCYFGNAPVGGVKTCQRDVPRIEGAVYNYPTSFMLGANVGSEFSIKTDTCSGKSMQTPCTMVYELRPQSTGYRTAVIMSSSGGSWGTLTGDGVLAPGGFDPNAGITSPLPPVVQSVSATGTASALNLSAVMNFGAMTGQQGNAFVGARVPPFATASGLSGTHSATDIRQASEASETWLVNNGTSWNLYLSGTIPPSFTGVLNSAASLVNILNNANTAGLCGTEFYVGYGTSGDSMLTNNTLGKIYTVICNYAFTASASGNADGLSLTANVQVATADAGKTGSFFVGRLLNGQWMLHNGSTWVSYSGGAVPPYSNGTLVTRQIQIFNSENLSSVVGAQIYVGYGTSDAEMLSSNRYGTVYTVQ